MLKAVQPISRKPGAGTWGWLSILLEFFIIGTGTSLYTAQLEILVVFFLLYLALIVFAVLPFVWTTLGNLGSWNKNLVSLQSEKKIKLFIQVE